MININPTALVQMAIFLVMMVVMNRLLFQPILKVIDERKERIEGDGEKAKELNAHVERKIQEYENQLREAKLSLKGEKDKLREEAQQEADQILRKTHEEAGDMIGELIEKIAGEYKEAQARLKQDAEAISRDISARVLGRAV